MTSLSVIYGGVPQLQQAAFPLVAGVSLGDNSSTILLTNLTLGLYHTTQANKPATVSVFFHQSHGMLGELSYLQGDLSVG